MERYLNMKKGQQAAKAPEPTKKSNTFDPKQYVKSGVSEEEVIACKQSFDLFDSDQGGTVDINGKLIYYIELKAAMTGLGFESKSGTIFQMIADMDTDGSGSIDFG